MEFIWKRKDCAGNVRIAIAHCTLQGTVDDIVTWGSTILVYLKLHM